MSDKAYIGVDGKKYCSQCNQSGFMGPKDTWKCRSPECQEVITAEAEEWRRARFKTNIDENKLGNTFSNSNPVIRVVSRSLGLSLLIIFFCFIGPYIGSSDPAMDPVESKASMRELRENWVAAGACAFISSLFILVLIESGIVSTSGSRSGGKNNQDRDRG